MNYARIGSSGIKASRIALGMMSYGDPAQQSWALDEERAESIVRQAVEAGVTFFDTADMYSSGVSEQITGRLLARLFSRRDDYVLATKVYYPTGPGRTIGDDAHIQDAVAATEITLSDEEVAALERPYLPRRMSDY